MVWRHAIMKRGVFHAARPVFHIVKRSLRRTFSALPLGEILFRIAKNKV
jgi:hypothetical protein